MPQFTQMQRERECGSSATIENTQIQMKMKLLFQKILEKDYVMNNYYADSLINKLCNGEDPETATLTSAPIISDLMIDALDQAQQAHNTVKVFLIRILAIVSKKELHFAKIFSQKSEVILKGFREVNSPNMNPSLRVAYMEVALALVFHNSGVSWILQNGLWKEILCLCNEKTTVFVVRQRYKFAAEFLWRLNDLGDETNVKLVFAHILKPMIDFGFLNVESMTSEEESVISKTIEPMVYILLSIVTECTFRIEARTIIISVLLKDYSILSHLLIVFDRMRREDIVVPISRLVYWLGLAKIFLAKPMAPDIVYVKEDFLDLGVLYFNTIQAFTQRRAATLLLDYCNACNLIWNSVWHPRQSRVELKDKLLNLNNNFLFICLVPSLTYVKCIEEETKDCRQIRCSVEDYITKMLDSSCEHTARACYALRDLILDIGVLPMALHSVKRLSCLKNHLTNEQANTMFQALFYTLKEYDPTDDEGKIMEDSSSYEQCEEKVLIMTYVLDTVLYLVKNYDINWHESLEVICLYSIVYNILKRTNLSCKFVVTALNVIAVTIKKFLPPNLSLLMDTKPGSTMHVLGKLIFMKMHDLNWEVRDSALELLHDCTEISFIKFPPFQNQLLEDNLINVAATIALNDHEYYVQVSALKCIGAASKVSKVWEKVTEQYPNIQEQIISILCNNQEGIVRKEACSVLCDIYQNLKLTPGFKNTLYAHMVSSALSDFHWEAQLSALKFWKIVIQSLLNDQGMLDGTFPPVTFSKESRKIVTLNAAEIQKRLSRILDELSSIGCLTVLVKLLDEDTEVDIMDASLSISLDLLNILSQYKVPEVLKHNDEDPKRIDELIILEETENNVKAEDVPEPNVLPTSDKVIDSIINTDDINLLANIYERRLNLESMKSEIIQPRIKLLKRATPYFFVNYVKSKDFKAIVEHKKKWKEGIRNVSSLLDDVLGIYELNDEVNTLDCY